MCSKAHGLPHRTMPHRSRELGADFLKLFDFSTYRRGLSIEVGCNAEVGFGRKFRRGFTSRLLGVGASFFPQPKLLLGYEQPGVQLVPCDHAITLS